MYGFYGVDTEGFKKLQPLMQRYNECIRKIVTKNTENRLELVKEKGVYQQEIQDILNVQVYIGQMDEGAYEKQAANYITTQLTEHKRVCKLAMELEDVEPALAAYLKEVVVHNQHLCVWVK